MVEGGLPFASDYRDARARFLQALSHFEADTGRGFQHERFVVDQADDLTIDCAQLAAPEPRRLYVAVSGIHGIEGFAGSAIQEALLGRVLPRFDLETTSVWLVHALNPFGMQRLRRVNAANVDLNRNMAVEGSSLYATASSGYALLAKVLGPTAAYDGRLGTRVRFFAALARAALSHGFTPMRQATLAGQYGDAHGVFYGGAEPQPETRFFQERFAALCSRHAEALLTDLHTGYGERGKAYPLFGRADSPAFREFVDQGVRDDRGKNQSYTAHGDLVGYCHHTAKRVRPEGVFNGAVVELGTRGLGMLSQLADLHAVVRENQVHGRGAADPAVAERVAAGFRELFDPRDPDWQRSAVRAALACIEGLLARCGYLALA